MYYETRQPMQIVSTYKRPSNVYTNSIGTNRITPTSPVYYKSNLSRKTGLMNRPQEIYSHQQMPIDVYNSKNANLDYHQVDRRQIISNEYPNGYYETTNVEPYDRPCCGLTRTGGAILFGSMAILAAIAFAGFIASTVLYAQDSTVNPEWKILGIVICLITLISIIITLILFFYCYKSGRLLKFRDSYINEYQRQTNVTSAYGYPPSVNEIPIRHDIIENTPYVTKYEQRISGPTIISTHSNNVQRKPLLNKFQSNRLLNSPIKREFVNQQNPQMLIYDIDQAFSDNSSPINNMETGTFVPQLDDVNEYVEQPIDFSSSKPRMQIKVRRANETYFHTNPQ